METKTETEKFKPRRVRVKIGDETFEGTATKVANGKITVVLNHGEHIEAPEADCVTV